MIKSVKIDGEWIEVEDLYCYYCNENFGSSADTNWLTEFNGDLVCDDAGCKHEAIQNYAGEQMVYSDLLKTEKSTKYPYEM